MKMILCFILKQRSLFRECLQQVDLFLLHQSRNIQYVMAAHQHFALNPYSLGSSAASPKILFAFLFYLSFLEFLLSNRIPQRNLESTLLAIK